MPKIAGLLVVLWAAFAHAECVEIPRGNGTFDTIGIYIAAANRTVNGIACYCQGVCTSPLPELKLSDSSGNEITLDGTLTCATLTSLSTWVDTGAFDADRDLVEGERLDVVVTNNPGSFDRVVACVR